MKTDQVIAGRYRLREKLGEGAMGVVWSGWQLGVERPVAIKFLKGHASAESRARLGREARALGKLNHPSCPIVYEVGEDEGRHFVVMELVDGEPLSTLRGEAQPIELVLQVGRQVAEALTHAHSLGIVHRDLKPENLLLTGSGAPTQVKVKVLDLGLAKLTGAEITNLTETGDIFGTPHYMSPEQLRGSRDVGPPTDLYALGVILFELIEGRLPFTGQSVMELGMAHLNTPAPAISRSDCPKWLAAVVAGLLHKDVRERIPSAQALAELLDRPGPTPTAWWLAGAGVVFVAMAVVVLWGTRTPSPAPPGVSVPKKPIAETPATVDDAPRVERPRVAAWPEGCGRTPPFSRVGLLDRQHATRVPSNYGEEGKPHPLIILAHDREADPTEALLARFADVADRIGAVLVAPTSGENPPWSHASAMQDHERMAIAVQAASSELCIDRSRVFLFGQGHGSHLARRMSCTPWLTAVATHALALGKDAVFCMPGETEEPKPYLMLSPTNSRREPLNGGVDCAGTVRRSFEEVEQMWRERNRCESKSAAWEKVGQSRCRSWTCEAPLRACEVTGGRQFPGSPPRSPLLDTADCDGGPGDASFPAAAEIADFFMAAPPLPEDQWFVPKIQ